MDLCKNLESNEKDIVWTFLDTSGNKYDHHTYAESNIGNSLEINTSLMSVMAPRFCLGMLTSMDVGAMMGRQGLLEAIVA